MRDIIRPAIVITCTHMQCMQIIFNSESIILEQKHV